MYHLQISSPHAVGGLSVLLLVSFAAEQAFSLMQSYLFIFAFVLMSQKVYPKNIFAKTNIKDFTPYISL